MVRHSSISNLTIVIVPVLIIALLLPSTFSNSNNDRSALLSLRSVLRGRTLRWNTTSETPCEWEGVECDDRTGRVISLRLPGDGLRGELASTHIGNLTELRALSLRGNALSGPIPDGIASCEKLRDLHLQGNRFSGEIPRWLFGLKNLQRVNLGSNELSGALSSEFNNLTELRVLYLESNRFAGGLPDLNGLTGLRRFNVSFNELVTGSIPPSLARFSSESFRGTSLCGGNLSSCSGNENSSSRDRKLSGGAKAGIIASGSLVVLISILVVLLMISRRKRSRNHRTVPHRIERSMLQYPSTVTPDGNRFSKPDHRPVTETDKDENTPPRRSDSRQIHAGERLENDGLVFLRGNSSNAFTLQELLMSSAQVMCKGATGTTYKAHLDHGVEVIVKRLKNVTLPENAFRHKIEALGSFDHENLLPLMGYFNGRDEKLLVYKSLPRGISLFELLHGNGKQKLSLEIRARIALGVARAIKYLHSTEREITHGNINSKNVLLSDYYEPHLCESGLMGLVSSSTPNLLSGYKAPEVSDMRSVSQQSDVYSFGVLLLELITGKEPERLLADEGIELSRWVRSSDDEGKRASEEAIDRELLSVAISCTDLRPEERCSMADVVMRITESLLGLRQVNRHNG